MTDTISLSDMLAPDETADDLVRSAVAELSAVFNWPYEATWEAVRERAGGERDPDALALAAGALYRDAVGEGQEPGQGLADSGFDGDGDQEDVAASAGWYDRDGYVDGFYVGSDEVSLSSGDEPLEGGWPARQAAAAYSLADSLSEQASIDVIGLVSRNPRLGQFFKRDLVELAAIDAAGGYIALDAVDEPGDDDDYQTMEDAHTGSEVERLSMVNDDLKGSLPKGSGRGHAHGSNHHPGCSKSCSRDHAQPAHGGTEHPEVDRLLDTWASKMHNREKPAGNAHVHRPLSTSELHAARRHAAGRSASRLTF